MQARAVRRVDGPAVTLNFFLLRWVTNRSGLVLPVSWIGKLPACVDWWNQHPPTRERLGLRWPENPGQIASRIPDRMSAPWMPDEVEAAVADYFLMLGMELRGEAYNKADHNRQLQRLLPERPRGSIERKHQNISAILIELGYPYIDGYKPLSNYQQLLRTIVEQRLAGATELQQTVGRIVESEVQGFPEVRDLLSIQVSPPVRDRHDRRIYDQSAATKMMARRDYLQIEARNHSLGSAGEQLILRFEHERLWRAGRRSLADRVEHVSRTQGDHLGYDIQSFETDGSDRLIEVKTTRFGALTPFFASRNEVAVSTTREREYQLYRLYNFKEEPKLFVLCGSLRYSCELEPASFIARPN